MKRNLFDELKEGFEALESGRKGKITLRQHMVDVKPAPKITPEELLELRRSCICLAASLPGICGQMNGRLKTGNRGGPARTHRPRS